MKNMSILFLVLLFQQSVFGFYPDNYQQSRQHFLELAETLKKEHPHLKLTSIQVPTQTDAELFIDTIFIPQRSHHKDRLLIVTSGIHGVEAFTGSAIQSQFLREQLDLIMNREMAVLIVHAVNPYGFHFKRRVSENNIDLNRNFSATKDNFEGTNESYARLKNFLNPLEPLNSSFWSDMKLFAKSLVLLIQYGKKDLTQAVVGGQYQFPKGIYYGGQSHEPNVGLIRKEFQRRGHAYKSVFHIDLHTGYGERGKLHYFINQDIIDSSPVLKNLFEGYQLDTEKKVDFYKSSGDFASFSINLFPNKIVIPMVFEFGTMDSQTIWGSFQSLKNMIYENQGFQYGYTSKDSKKRTEEQFLNMFNPQDQEWRDQVLKTSKVKLNELIERYINLDIESLKSEQQVK